MSRYIVKKSFNNNVVFCMDMKYKKECVLMGKGIGFSLRSGDAIKLEKNIEKKFFLMNEENIEKLGSLYNEIDYNIISVVEEAIQVIHNYFNKKLNERIHITLLDHVAFSISRYENGIDIKNPFITEIKLLYKDEYTAAIKVLDLINTRMNINLPKDEVGFIAMHIHAAISKNNIEKTTQNTAIVKDMIEFIESELGYKIDTSSIDYSRILIHLRFALDRINKNLSINNVLLDSIKVKLKESYEISCRMAEYIKKEYGIEIPDGEKGYIALHIGKIVNSYNNRV